MMLHLGGSVTDLYCGSLSTADICSEVLSGLDSLGALSHLNFRQWLFRYGSGYRELTLSDGSVWTLRLGREPGRYVHIHPSRYAPFTIRVKSGSLKSALGLIYLGLDFNVENINRVREKFTALPPVKNGSAAKQIGNIYRLLLQQNGGIPIGAHRNH